MDLDSRTSERRSSIGISNKFAKRVRKTQKTGNCDIQEQALIFWRLAEEDMSGEHRNQLEKEMM